MDRVRSVERIFAVGMIALKSMACAATSENVSDIPNAQYDQDRKPENRMTCIGHNMVIVAENKDIAKKCSDIVEQCKLTVAANGIAEVDKYHQCRRESQDDHTTAQIVCSNQIECMENYKSLATQCDDLRALPAVKASNVCLNEAIKCGVTLHMAPCDQASASLSFFAGY